MFLITNYFALISRIEANKLNILSFLFLTAILSFFCQKKKRNLILSFINNIFWLIWKFRNLITKWFGIIFLVAFCRWISLYLLAAVSLLYILFIIVIIQSSYCHMIYILFFFHQAKFTSLKFYWWVFNWGWYFKWFYFSRMLFSIVSLSFCIVSSYLFIRIYLIIIIETLQMIYVMCRHSWDVVSIMWCFIF